MTVAVDSNVLLDILHTGTEHHKSSRSTVRAAALVDELIVSEAVIAELSSGFTHERDAMQFISDLDIQPVASSVQALFRAGGSFGRYLQNRGSYRCASCGVHIHVDCPGCGAPVTRRQHILADFLIGAHALVHAGRLLTRDRGYYRTYFPELVLV